MYNTICCSNHGTGGLDFVKLQNERVRAIGNVGVGESGRVFEPNSESVGVFATSFDVVIHQPVNILDIAVSLQRRPSGLADTGHPRSVMLHLFVHDIDGIGNKVVEHTRARNWSNVERKGDELKKRNVETERMKTSYSCKWTQRG